MSALISTLYLLRRYPWIRFGLASWPSLFNAFLTRAILFTRAPLPSAWGSVSGVPVVSWASGRVFGRAIDISPVGEWFKGVGAIMHRCCEATQLVDSAAQLL